MGKPASKWVNLKMLPTIKVALPCFLLAIVATGGAKAFDFEPEGGWGQLWLNQTEPEGEIDQLGDLTVRRSYLSEAIPKNASMCRARNFHISAKFGHKQTFQ